MATGRGSLGTGTGTCMACAMARRATTREARRGTTARAVRRARVNVANDEVYYGKGKGGFDGSSKGTT